MAFLLVAAAVVLVFTLVRGARLSLARRLAQSVSAAALGAFAGHQLALWTVPAEVLARSPVGPMYASAGAVLGVLSVRVGLLIAELVQEFRRRRR